MSRRKRRHLKSPRSLTNQRKVKGTPVSAASFSLISLVFHVRVSYQLPSPSFHDNRASHSRDTIWPWKFKVKVKGTPVSAASSWLISLVFHIRASYRLTLEFQITAHACLFILIFLPVYSHSIWIYSLNQICVWCQPTPLLGPVWLTPRE